MKKILASILLALAVLSCAALASEGTLSQSAIILNSTSLAVSVVNADEAEAACTVLAGFYKDGRLTAVGSLGGVTAAPGENVFTLKPLPTLSYDTVKTFLLGADGAPLGASCEAVFESTEPPEADGVVVELADGNSRVVQGDARCVTLDNINNVVTLTAPGDYSVSGALADGQLCVSLPQKGDKAEIDLCGVNITCSDNAPFCALQGKVELSNKKGFTNFFTDGAVYAEGAKANACVYSACDIQLKGAGTMYVSANFNNGVGTKDDLRITKGTVNITAVNNALKGNDSIEISGGAITVASAGDGLKSDNEGADEGVVRISGGSLSVTAAGDGIQAFNLFEMSGGSLTVRAGGGSTGAEYDGDASCKGVKTDTLSLEAGFGLFISGGELNVDALDDALHSNGNMDISGGSLTIKSDDDGVHAENFLTISEADPLVPTVLTVERCYEGVEAFKVYINGGKLDIASMDDGINAAGDVIPADGYIEINGGDITVRAHGDGVDSNGSLRITGGRLLVWQSGAGNAALDYGDKFGRDVFSMTGGTLLACGSRTMACYPTVRANVGLIQTRLSVRAGAEVSVRDGGGNALLSLAAPFAFEHFVFCSDALVPLSPYGLYAAGALLSTVNAA